MANEFIARKGLISSGSIVVSGSVTASNFNGSLVGTSSWAYNAISSSHSTTASYALSSLNDAPVVIDNYTFIADGATTEYYISKSYSDSSIFVAVGGLTYINPDDYYLSASTLIFTEVPPSSSNISIKALVNVSQNVTGSFSGSFAGDGSGLVNVSAPLQIDTYTIDGDGTTAAFTLDKPYLPESLIVSVDGLVYTYPTDYTVSGTTLTFVDTPTSASTIIVRGFMNTGNVTGSFSGSFVGNGNGLLNVSASFVEYNAIANKPSLVSSSQQINTGSFSGSITTSSFATTASYILPTGLPIGTVSSSTASSPSQGTVRVTINGVNADVDTGLQTGDSPTFAGLTVDGTITAKEFYTQFVSSSIIYQSGSTKFGDSDDDVMSVTGSLIVSGSGTFKNIGPSQFSGSVSTTTDMFIGGNVGIGTTTPARILTVYTSASTSRILLQNSSTGQAINNGFDLSMATSGQADIWNYQNADIRIATNNSERMRITSGGFVGIGTSTPSNDFVLARNNNVVLDINAGGSAAYSASLQLGTDTRNWRFTAGKDTVAYELSVNYVGTDAPVSNVLVLTKYGNVGIGTTGSNYPLQIRRSGGAGSLGITVDNVFSASDRTTKYLAVGDNASDFTGHVFYVRNGNATDTASLSIRYDGNVGIGTTIPNEKLEISGSGNHGIRISTAGNTSNDYAALRFYQGGAEAGVIYTNQNTMQLSVAGSPRVYINSYGLVGINTTDPKTKLHVEGSATIGTTGTEDVLLLGRALTNGVSFQQAASFKLGRYQNAGGAYESYTRLDIALRDNSAASNYNTNTTVMTLTNAGNVGIGVTNPSYKLDISGSVNSHRYIITEASASVPYEGALTFPTDNKIYNVIAGPANGPTVRARWSGGTTNRYLELGQTDNLGIYTPTVRIAEGNVGIGTTTPIYKLDVSGSLGLSGFMFAEKLGNYNRIYEPAGNASIYLGNATDPTNYYDNSVHQWRNRGGGTDYMRLNSVGNLGIGVTDPQAKLHVAGDIRFGTNGVYTDLRTFTDTALSGYNQTNTITPTTVPGGGTATSALYLKTAGSGPGYNRLDLITDGRIGIGTTSPLNLLHIEGSNAFARISNPSTGDGGLKISYQNSDTHGLHLSYNPNNALSYIDNTYPTSSGTVYGDIYFRQNINGTMTSRMIIQAQTGNVGINVIPNNAKLEVVATSGEVFRADAAGGAYRIVANQTGVYLNGNVGIGTTSSPTYKLNVIGSTNSNLYYSNDVSIGYHTRININNVNFSTTGSSISFDSIGNDSDGGGTSWQIVKDNYIYLYDTSGAHGGTWGYPVYLEAGYYRIGGSVRLTSTNGFIHGNTSPSNYKYSIGFGFNISGGPSTGMVKWDVDTLGDGARAGFMSAPVYMSAGNKQILYYTNGYEGIKKLFITDLYIERVG